MAEETIEKLDELISDYVDKSRKLKDTKICRLTKPGENFGSLILKVDLTFEDDKKETTEVKVVAKLLPKLEFFQKLFNVQVTFKLEKAFYDTIIPTLNAFQYNHGPRNVLECFPKFYGARLNLNGSDKVDSDAVILLENLKEKGYYNVDRSVGCSSDVAKLILKDLARFHAVPIALKLKEPILFEEKIKKNMGCSYPPPPKIDKSVPNATLEAIIEEDDNCRHLVLKVRESMKYDGEYNTDVKEPYVTITHQDLWVNNFMIKYEKKILTSNKFVDFQGCTYDSPIRDVLFFLFTSVQFDVLQDQLDKLLEYYHQYFEKTLEDLGCSTDEFAEEHYFDELYRCGIMEIYHILFMYLFIVTGKKGGTVPTLDEQGVPPLPTQEEIPRAAKRRAWWILQEFHKRGWLGA